MPITTTYETTLAKAPANFSECPECRADTLYHYRWGKQDNFRCATCNYPNIQSGSYEWDVPPSGEAPQLALGSYPRGNKTGDHLPVGPGNSDGLIGRDPRIKTPGAPDNKMVEYYSLRKKQK